MEYAQELLGARGYSITELADPKATHLVLPWPALESPGRILHGPTVNEVLLYAGGKTILAGSLGIPGEYLFHKAAKILDYASDEALLAGNAEITAEGEDFTAFMQALNTVTVYLCRCIAGDGEGATKLLECKVSGAATLDIAKTVAKSVICSSLTKAAMFGADANWGRVLCAIGYSGAPVDVNKIDVQFASKAGTILVCENGAGVDFSEEQAKKILLEHEIEILIDLKSGSAASTAWGCDLTYDYVKINGDYRT